ncbi:hypothetical protein ACFL6U_13350 [Planctomycetota bacterium]
MTIPYDSKTIDMGINHLSFGQTASGTDALQDTDNLITDYQKTMEAIEPE